MRQRTNGFTSGKAEGFTMIELLFAMSFVSVLLIIILTASLQVTRIYNKGITLKQVNQSGASIGSELQSSLKAVDAPLDTSTVNRGRLCLGTYSYVWNTPDITPANTLSDNTTIGMVKVNDTGAKMCTSPYPKPQASSSRELILGAAGASGVQLMLRDFDVTQTANSGTNYVYHVSFTVSTGDKTLIANDKCRGGASDEFCALNSFDFSVFMKQGGDGSV